MSSPDNDSLGFSWNMQSDIVIDYYSLSPGAEAFVLTEELIEEINYMDAMARHIVDEFESSKANTTTRYSK